VKKKKKKKMPAQGGSNWKRKRGSLGQRIMKSGWRRNSSGGGEREWTNRRAKWQRSIKHHTEGRRDYGSSGASNSTEKNQLERVCRYSRARRARDLVRSRIKVQNSRFHGRYFPDERKVTGGLISRDSAIGNVDGWRKHHPGIAP